MPPRGVSWKPSIIFGGLNVPVSFLDPQNAVNAYQV